jgi:RNA polymerase primary sigma factor
MKLIDCALTQFIADWPVSESLRAIITSACSFGKIPFKTIGEYHNAGSRTQIEWRKSLCLYGDLAREFDEFMADAVDVYLTANPSIASVKKEIHKLDGVQDVNPRSPMRYQTSDQDSYSKEKTNLNDSLEDLSISEFIRDKDISVRLRNALGDDENPFSTVREYVEAGVNAEERFSRIRNVGRKTAREFQILVNEAIANQDSYSKEKTNLNDSLGDLSISEFIRDKDISVRLRNALGDDENPFSTVREYVEAGVSAEGRLLRIRNMGRETVREFQALINEAITEQDSYPENYFNMSDCSEKLSVKIIMTQLSKSISERDFEILKGRSVHGLTLEEVGELFSLTRERVRQIVEVNIVSKFKRIFLDRSKELYDRILKKIKGKAGKIELLELKISFSCEIEEIKTFTFLVEKSSADHCERIRFEKGFAYLNPSDQIETIWKKEIEKELFLSNWPISIDDLICRTPSIPDYYVVDHLKAKYKAKIVRGIIEKAKIPLPAKYVYMFRKARRALHISEARILYYNLFGEDISLQLVNATLGRLKEALIVDIGTYNTYENLQFLDSQISGIREKVHGYLIKEGQFVSSKAIFENLFNYFPEEWDQAFNHYMMLGIVQDDSRFLTKPGLMIGLRSFEGRVLFRSLENEVIDIITKQRPILVKEIFTELSKTRGLCNDTGLRNILSNNINIVRVAQNKYDLLCSIFNSEASYEDFILQVIIILFGGPQSLQSISEKLNQLISPTMERCSMESILKSSECFKFKNGIYQTNKISSKLKHYDRFIKEANRAGQKAKDIRDSLEGNTDMKKLFLKYLAMDPRMIIETGDRPEPKSGKKTELYNILDEFKF